MKKVWILTAVVFLVSNALCILLCSYFVPAFVIGYVADSVWDYLYNSIPVALGGKLLLSMPVSFIISTCAFYYLYHRVDS